jgi:photosystem II stability/assembly factor-like uncharacterized protein
MSETYKGQYAPELFNERKRYYLLQAQEQTNLTDAELRDLNTISGTFTRRFIQGQVGDSAIDTGFKIAEYTNPVNNFLITGGANLESPGTFHLKGYRLFLTEDITYKDQTSTGAITDDGYTKTILPVLTTPTGSTSRINDIELTGSVLVACDATGNILRSIDWGRNWTIQNGSSNSLSAISFGDTSTGFVVGDMGSVFTSTDGGVTWTDIHGTLPSDYLNKHFYGASFINASAGWIVGEPGIDPGILITPNGGATWSSQGTGVVTGILKDINNAGSLIAWTVGLGTDGTSGNIFNTTDGINWAQVYSSTYGLNKIQSIDGTNLYAVGNHGTVLRGSSIGTVWIPKTIYTSSDLNDLYFSDILNGWVVGNDGTLARTSDGATTWTKTIVAPGVNLKAIEFKDSTGFIAGDNGRIYRTFDRTSWELYRTDYAYIDFHLGEVCADATSGSEYIDIGLQDSTVGLPRSNRLRIVSDVKVSEGWPTPSDYTVGSIQHYTTSLAKIQRNVGQTGIYNADITDLRKVVRTIAEIDNLFSTGGIDSSALASGSITPDKLDITADYTMGSVNTSGDILIGGDLTVEGTLFIKDMTRSTIMDNLQVNGSSILGDSTSPYDDTVRIFGHVLQSNDVPASTYTMQVGANTQTFPVFNIISDGSGNIFNINRTSTTTLALMDVTSHGKGYDFHISHLGTQGGIFSLQDDASNDTIVINKNAPGNTGTVFTITTNSIDPVINIINNAPGSNSILIDQTHGNIIQLHTPADATGLSISSTTGGQDIRIDHSGSSGNVLSIRSDSLINTIDVLSTSGPTMALTQKANETVLTVIKDGTEWGQGLEIYNRGRDVGLGVYNESNGIGQLISHVGDSTMAGLDIFVAGTVTGPALRINKSNDETGEAIKIWNQGYSESIFITQDASTHDSSATMIRLHNENNSYSYDMSSDYWWVDNSGNFFGRAFYFDASFQSNYHLDSSSMWFDASSMDSSNPGVIGKVYRESGFLRISDGTNVLPPFGMGVTGIQGITGTAGSKGNTGIQGYTGLALGATGIQGSTGIQGQTGIQGADGQTGIQGETGIQGIGQTGIQGAEGQTGIQGVDGQTGIQGLQGEDGQTGVQGLQGADGQTGVQGETGIQGADGQTGIQGETGTQGITGFYGQTGIQGNTGTGIQGETGFYGQTGIQGETGFYGQTGVQGLTGFYGQTGIQGNTGIQGLTGIAGSANLVSASTMPVVSSDGTAYVNSDITEIDGTYSLGTSPFTGTPKVIAMYAPSSMTVTSPSITLSTASAISIGVNTTYASLFGANNHYVKVTNSTSSLHSEANGIRDISLSPVLAGAAGNGIAMSATGSTGIHISMQAGDTTDSLNSVVINDSGLTLEGQTSIQIHGGSFVSIQGSSEAGPNNYEINLHASNTYVQGAFACNDATPQTPYVLGNACTDTSTCITLANNLRNMAIAFGFGTTS